MPAARILVLDDDPALAEMLVETLQVLGHQASYSPNPLAAIELFSDGEFDLVISDYRMPELDGAGFYQVVRERFPEMAPRIVFLTGDTLNQDTRDFLQSTGNAYLTKPFKLEDVKEAIEQARRPARLPQAEELSA
jgi:CheY-like chemotaxis protein